MINKIKYCASMAWDKIKVVSKYICDKIKQFLRAFFKAFCEFNETMF